MATKACCLAAPAPVEEKLTEEQIYVVPKRRSVLLIEDDPDMRSLLAEALGDEGFEVLEAEDSKDLTSGWGLDLTDAKSFSSVDVIVSDVILPGKNGLEILGDLQRIGRAKSTILISAFAGPEMAAVATGLGASAILPKPFSLQAFIEEVKKVAIRNGDSA